MMGLSWANFAMGAENDENDILFVELCTVARAHMWTAA